MTDAPYFIEMVEWVDAAHNSASRIDIPTPTTCYGTRTYTQFTAGWLVNEDAECVEIALVLEPHPEKKGEWICGYVETIPHGIIVRRERWGRGASY